MKRYLSIIGIAAAFALTGVATFAVPAVAAGSPVNITIESNDIMFDLGVVDVERDTADTIVLAAGGNAGPACADGTAPEGWQRPSGFCELAAKGPDRLSKKATPS